MSRHTASLPPSYFDERYAQDPDPWQFATSAYERDKYAATLQALPRRQYVSALEIGCSIGVLTHDLAERCHALLGIDVAEAALAQARDRCRNRRNVSFARAQVPSQWPAGAFDLIIMSEVVYYLDAGDVTWLAERVRNCLRPGGDVVLVHWTGETHYPLSGDEAAERFIDAARRFLCPLRHSATDKYRLDVLASCERGEGVCETSGEASAI